MRIRVLVGLSCIIAVAASAPQLAANETNLPFVLHKGYTIVVQGSIGGRKGLNFIIDSGAVPSVIDSRLSRRLRLAGDEDRVSVFARTVSVQRVVLPEVHIGPVHAVGVAVLVQDLSFIEIKLGVRIEALIGLDVLGRTNFSIDFAAGCLRFGASPDPDDVWADMSPDADFAAIEIELNHARLRLLVDTGVNHLVLFGSRTEGLFAVKESPTGNVSSTIGGEVQLRQVEPPVARLGRTPLALTSVMVLETPADLSLAIDGLLGVAALKPLRVDFNFGRRAIGWKW